MSGDEFYVWDYYGSDIRDDFGPAISDAGK
jgi:hypothetical protein